MLRRSPVLIPRRSERDRRRKIESGLRVMEREREKFEFERERVRENDAKAKQQRYVEQCCFCLSLVWDPCCLRYAFVHFIRFQLWRALLSFHFIFFWPKFFFFVRCLTFDFFFFFFLLFYIWKREFRIFIFLFLEIVLIYGVNSRDFIT